MTPEAALEVPLAFSLDFFIPNFVFSRFLRKHWHRHKPLTIISHTDIFKSASTQQTEQFSWLQVILESEVVVVELVVVEADEPPAA